MFQKIQKMYREAKEYAGEISAKAAAFAFALQAGTPAKAQSTAGDYSAVVRNDAKVYGNSPLKAIIPRIVTILAAGRFYIVQQTKAPAVNCPQKVGHETFWGQLFSIEPGCVG